MDQPTRNSIQQHTATRHILLRLSNGVRRLLADKRLQVPAAFYVTLFIIVFFLRVPLSKIVFPRLPSSIEAASTTIMFILILFAFFASSFGLMLLLGTPWQMSRYARDLRRIGMVNHADEAPLLLKVQSLPNTSTKLLMFASVGLPIKLWKDKQDAVETALNLHIIDITEGPDKRFILIKALSGSRKLPSTLPWINEYIDRADFTVVLGEDLLGTTTVNLAKVPHILLGGSTGSGKSVLLKLVLFQCIQKEATVYLSDFKGGVDYRKIWHEKCTMIFNHLTSLETLTSIVDELERRKVVLQASGYANINEYNLHSDKPLERVVFACDEVAEMLDKKGLSKEERELIDKLIAKLATIARQGRAFGIHLILATQRPDADVIPGQIKNNIDFRACGRADNTLSIIILDNGSAHEHIPKDAQGRFITNSGTIFQAYLLDEQKIFTS